MKLTVWWCEMDVRCGDMKCVSLSLCALATQSGSVCRSFTVTKTLTLDRIHLSPQLDMSSMIILLIGCD